MSDGKVAMYSYIMYTSIIYILKVIPILNKISKLRVQFNIHIY